MQLTILSVAYPLATVGPDAVGGAEQVLSQLDQAIVQAGHHSILVAQEGSRSAGVCLSIGAPTGALDQRARTRAERQTRAAVERALREFEVDLVHMHGVDFVEYLPAPGPPVLGTLHLPAFAYTAGVWRLERPLTFVHGVSASQHASLPKSSAQLLTPITNGVPLDLLRGTASKGDFVLSLGRVCPEKGFSLAAEAARKAGVKLVLAGAVFPYPEHQRYFETILRPFIREGVIEFVGAAGLAKKRDLLGRARCLLVPSQTPETSSLVAMEALACGTPVIAFRAGALVEIVEDGRTGFLVDSVDEMAEAIIRLEEIDPSECRRAAEERFSANRMTAQYLDRYERIVRLTRPRRSHPSVGVVEVTSVDGLASKHDEWTEVWRQSRSPSVFQHPDWLIPWCRPFGVNQPWAMLVKRDQQLVGVVPMVVYQRGSERVLTLLGAGVSDDQGIVAVGGAERFVLEVMWEHLARHADAFDVCELENLFAESVLLDAPAPGWTELSRRQRDVRPVLQFPDAASFDRVVPNGMRKRLRYAEGLARRAGLSVRTTHVRVENFDELFDGLVRLHRARWMARGKAGVMPPDLEGFHREAARKLLTDRILRMHGLYFGERLGAVFYGYHAGGRTIYYLSGFDPELERFSPGNLVVAEAIRYAIEHDHARAFDFLRGAEAYKYAWGAVDEPLYDISLTHVT